jgi:hypothetical protein
MLLVSGGGFHEPSFPVTETAHIIIKSHCQSECYEVFLKYFIKNVQMRRVDLLRE